MGYFGQPRAPAMPIDCTPPMNEWAVLHLPAGGNISMIAHLRLPNLYWLDLNANPVSSLPWAEMASLRYLSAAGALLTSVQLNAMPYLQSAMLSSNGQLTQVSCDDLGYLTTLDCSSCSAMEGVSIAGCGSLMTLNVSFCGLGQSVVDQLLESLVYNGAEYGYAEFWGNAAPSAAGQDNVAALIARGWTVYTS